MTAMQRALVALAVLAVAVGGVVTLTLAGHDAAALAAWLIPIVTGVWGVGEIRATAREQDSVLLEIAENVNGKLDARIRRAVAQALDEPYERARQIARDRVKPPE